MKRETVERHLGQGSGPQAYVWTMLLAGMTVGGLYLAFPVACSLAKKGARLGFDLRLCEFRRRLPNPHDRLLKPLSWAGNSLPRRMIVSIPLVILASELLGIALEHRGYTVHLD